MDPKAASSYKNFLPSKKLMAIVGSIALVAVLCFLVPKLVTLVKNRKDAAPVDPAMKIAIPSGDPTTRDTDGDGVPDWQEIAVGLNPFDTETTKGTPDATAFENIKSVVGSGNFQTISDNATDSDKVGLAVYNDLSQNSIQGGDTTGGSVSNVTAAEVINYMNAAKAKNKTYSNKDISITDNSSESVHAYYQAVMKVDVPFFDQDFITHLTNYIDNKETKDVYMAEKTVLISNLVAKLLTIPVPSTAVALHLGGINALAGIQQTIDSYSPNNDSLSQLGTVGLVQDYIRTALVASANLSQYFSLSITPNSTKK